MRGGPGRPGSVATRVPAWRSTRSISQRPEIRRHPAAYDGSRRGPRCGARHGAVGSCHGDDAGDPQATNRFNVDRITTLLAHLPSEQRQRSLRAALRLGHGRDPPDHCASAARGLRLHPRWWPSSRYPGGRRRSPRCCAADRTDRADRRPRLPVAGRGDRRSARACDVASCSRWSTPPVPSSDHSPVEVLEVAQASLEAQRAYLPSSSVGGPSRPTIS